MKILVKNFCTSTIDRIKRTVLNSLWLLFIPLMFATCTKEQLQHAGNSVQGTWNVIEIKSIYYDGGRPTVIEEDGLLGNFNFMADSVSFEFTRNDTLYAGNSAWDLKLEKVNDGFYKRSVYTLTIEDQFAFDVTFEDGTTWSEKDAQQMTFLNGCHDSVPELCIELLLEKN